jgi:uncharacterized membrane protein YqgA involved in biofilm formation
LGLLQAATQNLGPFASNSSVQQDLVNGIQNTEYVISCVEGLSTKHFQPCQTAVVGGKTILLTKSSLKSTDSLILALLAGQAAAVSDGSSSIANAPKHI